MTDELETLRRANKELAECLENTAWTLKNLVRELQFEREMAESQAAHALDCCRRTLAEHAPEAVAP